jgi:plastocyanin
MKKSAAVLVALVIASLGLVACGGSDDSSDSSAEATITEEKGQSGATTEAESGGGAEGGTAGSASSVQFEAVSGADLAYKEKSATAKSGSVTIDFTNPQSIPHNVYIEDEAGEDVAETETISEGSTSAKAELEPGTYTFFCDIPGHREAGMEGTLTVK